MAIATVGADLFHLGVPVLEKAIRTVAVYGGILVLLRLGGKRDLAQLNSFDLVVLLLLSNVVQNAIIGNDNSLAGGLLGAAILVGVNAGVVRFVRRNDRFVWLFEGRATTLVKDGQMIERNVRHLGLRPDDIMTAIRKQGANTIGEVEEASLKPGGAIVVQLRPRSENATRSDIERLERKVDELSARLAAP
jgi:uncharacterized membrane protein YcaP (DUF421 family)